MGDADSYTQRLEIPSQRLVSEAASPIPQNQANQSKFFSHFLYKALSVAIVLVILPLFPSQAPEFVNQTIFTRSWELLHLLFVGIAVSYGLFSRRNFETEKEIHVKNDTAQTYMSRILQVSSVFDDEIGTPFGSDDSKIETWNSKYFRGEPDVIVEEEPPVLDEETSVITNVSDIKPLLLPVRSLKSSVSDSNSVKSVSESPRSLSRSGSGGKKGSGSSTSSDRNREREVGDLDPSGLEEKFEENFVLPSPIPWRTRSGRFEMKDEMGGVIPPMYSLPPSAEESELDQIKLRNFPSSRGRSSQSNSTSPSPKKISPSPSPSPELRTKSMEDSVKKKSVPKSSPPPAPPLPPLPLRVGAPKYRTTSKPSSFSDEFFSEENLKSGFQDELQDSRNAREVLPRRRDFGMDSLKEEVQLRTRVEGPLTPRSVRTIRGNEPVADAKKTRDVREQPDRKTENKHKEVDVTPMEKPRRKNGESEKQSMRTEKQNGESLHPTPKATFSIQPEKQNGESLHPTPKATFAKYPNRKKKLDEKIIFECEEYSSSDADDDVQEDSPYTVEADSGNVSDGGPDPNEVDKKADEFIAKFREQIRLQRIDSIKRTSGQQSLRNSSR